MTQVAQIFEEEKQQALTQAAQVFEEEKQHAEKQATQSAYRQVVIQMIKKGYPAEEIATLVSSYSQDDVETLRKELVAEKK